MDWYSYEVEETDENGEIQKKVEYRFHEQRLSNKEMKSQGYTNYLGKVHFSENTYFGLEGGTTNTSDYTATINAMTEDFGKMGDGDAIRNMSKAESYLSGIGWNAELPTMVGLGPHMFVVPFSSDNYTKLTDKSLKREFDTKYQSQRNTIRYMSPVDTRTTDLIGVLASFPLPYKPNYKARNSYLISFYKRSNIIR